MLAVLSAAAADTSLQGPVFVLEPPNKIDFSNSTGTVVECAARGSPAPRVAWVRGDGQPVDDVTGLRQVSRRGTADRQVRRSDCVEGEGRVCKQRVGLVRAEVQVLSGVGRAGRAV